MLRVGVEYEAAVSVLDNGYFVVEDFTRDVRIVQ